MHRTYDSAWTMQSVAAYLSILVSEEQGTAFLGHSRRGRTLMCRSVCDLSASDGLSQTSSAVDLEPLSS